MGEQVTISIGCPERDFQDPLASFNSDRGANETLIEVPRVAPMLYETTVVVPYWIAPGTTTVFGGCGDSSYFAPDPVTIEVLSSAPGANAWQPLQLPWADPDRVPGSATPTAVEENRVYGRWGESLRVHALCDAEIPVGGARFVVWVDAIMEPPFFYAVEYPVAVADYDVVDAGVVISADVVIDRDDFPSDDDRGPMRIDALCVDTPTPFIPDPVPDMPRLTVGLE